MEKKCNLWKAEGQAYKTGNYHIWQYNAGTKAGIYGFYKEGFVLKNMNTIDMNEYCWIKLHICVKKSTSFAVELTTVRDKPPTEEDLQIRRKMIYLTSEGEHEIFVHTDEFDLPQSQSFYWGFVRGMRILSESYISIKSVYFQTGREIKVEVPVKSKAVEAGEWAEYPIYLSNCTEERVVVQLEWKSYGWQVLNKLDLPRLCRLDPMETRQEKIRVWMSDRVVPGGYERQQILLTAQGRSREVQEIEFMTVRAQPHPHVLLKQKEIQELRTKIRDYSWAGEKYKVWLQKAQEWDVSVINPDKEYLFCTEEAHNARNCAVMYRVSADEGLRKKVVCFLKELTNPRTGYLRLPRACNQELVHEGEFFKSAAIAYDLVYDAPELGEKNHQIIETALRRAADVFEGQLCKGEISNWTLAQICGGVYIAAVLQDYTLIQRFLYGKGGAAEHLAKGILSDGWWFEVSVGYNLMCAGLFAEIAQVVSHYGINFKDICVPASYSTSVNSSEIMNDGLSDDIWGENTRNYRTISMLFDSLMPFFDFNGIIFGINDSTEMKASGMADRYYDPRYDLAWKLYKKPEYAALLSQTAAADRDLLFGEGELPIEMEKELIYSSAYADNAGVIVLRSATTEKSARDRLQIGVKYGSHGGAHGHYDRCSITSIRRYGRSLTGPENIWYGYHTFMYKFYVQNSVNHNMVTVDLKQQEPSEPRRLMFSSGNKMQVSAVENFGRWSHPPYGGWQVNGDQSFRERSWNEGRYVPILDEAPPYTKRSGFTEPICTRRLTIVTDDFMLNFDYAFAQEIHSFECLWHLQGLQDIDGLSFKKHTEQLDEDSAGSAQFITDCSWYHMEGVAKIHFHTEFDEHRNNGGHQLSQNRTAHNEFGVLDTNLHLLYPLTAEVAIAAPPEYQSVNKQLFYKVEADGSCLEEGSFGAWILGREYIDVDVAGKEELVLCVTVNQVEFEKDVYIPMEQTVFWGNPVIETEDGDVIDLKDIHYQSENIEAGGGIGIDYAGGPVKIQAKLFEKAVPAEPADVNEEAVIRIPIKGLRARRFRACIGGDYPVGNEEDRRRTVMLRMRGNEVSFVTLLETVEGRHEVLRAECRGKDKVVVEMRDGRNVIIEVDGLDEASGNNIEVTLAEYNGSEIIRKESTAGISCSGK